VCPSESPLQSCEEAQARFLDKGRLWVTEATLTAGTKTAYKGMAVLDLIALPSCWMLLLPRKGHPKSHLTKHRQLAGLWKARMLWEPINRAVACLVALAK
jgi:hypothetical protein